MANELGGQITLDISDFTKKINIVNKQIRENEAVWKQSASALGDWTKSEEGLRSRLEVLNEKITKQKEILELLNQKKAKVIELYGEESNEVDAVNKEILKYAKTLDNMYTEIDSVTKSLNKMVQAQKDSEEQTDDSTTSINSQNKAIADLKSTINSLKGSLENASKGFTVLKGVISNLVTQGINKATSGLKSFVSLVDTLPDSTDRLRRAMVTLGTAFNNAGFTAQQGIDTYIQLKANLGYVIEDVESATTLIAKLSNAEEDLSTWNEILAGTYATVGKTFPINEYLKNLTVTASTGKMTEYLRNSLETAGYSSTKFQSELDKLNTEEERSELIMQRLSSLYGQAGKNYAEANKAIAEGASAAERYNVALATFGNALQPIKTEFTNAKTDILNALADVLSGVEGAENDLAYSLGYILGSVAKVFNQLKDLIKPAWNNVTESLKEWWNENKESLKDNLKEGIKEWFGIDIDSIKSILKVGLFATIATAIASFCLKGGIFAVAGIGIASAILGGIVDEETLNKWIETILPDWLGKIVKGINDSKKVIEDAQSEVVSSVEDYSSKRPLKFFPTYVTDEVDEKVLSSAKRQNGSEELMKLDLAMGNIIEDIQKIDSTSEDAFENYVSSFTALRKLMVDYRATAGKEFIEDLTSIADEPSPNFNRLLKRFKELKENIKELFTDTVDSEEIRETISLDDYFSQLEIETKEGVQTLRKTLDTEVPQVLGTMASSVTLDKNSIKRMLRQTTKTVVDDIPNEVDKIEDSLIDNTTNTINSLSSEVSQPVQDAGSNVVDEFLQGWKDALEGNVSKLRATVEETVNDVAKDATIDKKTIWQKIKEFVGKIQDWYLKEWEDRSFWDKVAKVATTGLVEGVQFIPKVLESTFTEVIPNLLSTSANAMDAVTEEVASKQNELVELLRTGEWDTAFTKYGVKISEDVKEGILRGKINAKDYAKSILPDTKGASDEIASSLMSTLTDAIKSTGSWGMLIGTLLDVASTAIENGDVDEYINNLVDMIMGALEKIIDNLPSIIEAMGKLMQELAKGLVKGIPKLVEALPDILATLVSTIITDFIPAMWKIGIELVKGIGQGIWDSISNLGNWLWEGVEKVANWIVGGFKKLFGIKSPSKIMADIVGKNITLGIAEGMVENADAISKSVSYISDTIDFDTDKLTETSLEGAKQSTTVVNQYNTYAREHSRYELYKSRKQLEDYFVLV